VYTCYYCAFLARLHNNLVSNLSPCHNQLHSPLGLNTILSSNYDCTLTVFRSIYIPSHPNPLFLVVALGLDFSPHTSLHTTADSGTATTVSAMPCLCFSHGDYYDTVSHFQGAVRAGQNPWQAFIKAGLTNNNSIVFDKVFPPTVPPSTLCPTPANTELAPSSPLRQGSSQDLT
jgi:hypothetical protein